MQNSRIIEYILLLTNQQLDRLYDVSVFLALIVFILVIVKNSIFAFVGLVVCGLILFSAQPSFADCVNPSETEEGRIVYSSSQNVPMYCNGTDWIAMGLLNPAAGGAGCSTVTMGVKPEGHIFYNLDGHLLQYCDGDDWHAVGTGLVTVGGSGFATFSDLTDQTVSTLITSIILQVRISGSTSITITGDGSPEYRICADDACSVENHTWDTAAGTIDDGEFLQLRLTSNALFGTMNSATVTVGTSSDQWDVVTENLLSSCKAILDAGIGTVDGTYTIDPDGAGGNAAFQVYCDMTTTGGGWTVLVGNNLYSSGVFPFSPTKNGVGMSYPNGEFWSNQGTTPAGSCHTPAPSFAILIEMPHSEIKFRTWQQWHNIPPAIKYVVDFGDDGQDFGGGLTCGTACSPGSSWSFDLDDTHSLGPTVAVSSVRFFGRACQNWPNPQNAKLRVYSLMVR